MASAPVRIDPGTVVGPYVVERLLVRGAVSVVYVARDAAGDRVALRVLLPDRSTSATRARVQREGRALSALGHPGVAAVRATGEREGAPWIAMDYVRGTDLQRLLAERGPLSPDLAIEIAIQVAEALAAAHQAGLVHRDLKPSSVVVTPEGRAVLVDFGVVRRRPDGTDGASSSGDPDAGADVAYLAPEVIELGLADERSDLWALGCVMCELVTGAPPFGRGGPATLAAILRDDPLWPASVPPSLASILANCLRKSSFARVGSARELLSMLRDAHVEARTGRPSMRASASPPARNPSRPPPPGRPSPLPPAPATGAGSSARIAAAAVSSARVAAARGHIKGAALRAGLAWFAGEYGEPGLTRVFELASAELASVLRKDDPAFGIIASGWYDTAIVGEMLGLVERVASPADPGAFAVSVAEAIAEDNVRGVYRALFRLVASPAMLAANAQRVWRTYVDEGTLSVSLRGPGAFEASVRGWTHHHPVVCLVLRAMLERLLRAVGYSGLVVERARCIDQGAADCAFRGTWGV